MTSRGTKNNPPAKDEILSVLPKEKALSQTEIDKKFGTGCVVFWRMTSEEQYTTEEKTQDQLKAEAFKKPASRETIMAHLMRMTAHKPVKGSGDHQTAYLLSDYTSRLLDENVTEVDLFLACENIIENSESDFYPSYAKLIKEIRSI